MQWGMPEFLGSADGLRDTGRWPYGAGRRRVDTRQARGSAMAADRQAALTFAQCAAAFIAVKEKE